MKGCFAKTLLLDIHENCKYNRQESEPWPCRSYILEEDEMGWFAFFLLLAATAGSSGPEKKSVPPTPSIIDGSQPQVPVIAGKKYAPIYPCNPYCG